MLKVGLVGIGGMGGVHYNSYKELNDIKVTAVCDVRVDMAKEKTAEDNIPVYATMEEMLQNEELDIIDICTPSYLHAEQAIGALKKGYHVISEKPMALHYEDAKKISETAKESGKLFMVAHVLRFMKSYQFLKQTIESQKYGKLIRLDMKRISSIPCWSWDDWMRDFNRSGLVTFDLSIHDIDFMQYLFGNPKQLQSMYYPKKENSTYVVCNYLYDGFSVSTEATFYNARVKFSMQYYAVFENGYIELKDNQVYANGEPVELGEDSGEDTGTNITRFDAYPGELDYFANCVRTLKKPEIVTPESSANSIRLAEQVLKEAVIVE